MTAFALHFLRHGAPVGAGRLIGRTDARPTDAGIAACVAQAEDLVPEVVIASDLARARAPATVIGARIGVAPIIDARWRELDFGDWDGLATDAVDPAALARFWDDPDRDPPPRGERWSALVHRVTGALAALEPRTTLVVTHAGTIRAVLAALCGFAQRETWAIDLPYASLVSLRVWPDMPRTAQIMALYP